LAISLVALLGLFAVSRWIPADFREWDFIDPTGGWGLRIWEGTLVAFLGLQLLLKPAPNPNRGIGKWLSFGLISVVVVGVADFILTSFWLQAEAVAGLDPNSFNIALRTSGAILTLFGFLASVRFFLTKF
jgi:hypothetical protein